MCYNKEALAKRMFTRDKFLPTIIQVMMFISMLNQILKFKTKYLMVTLIQLIREHLKRCLQVV